MIMKNKKRRAKKSNNKSLRRNFEIFGKGIQRLEELRIELNNLNTAGYEKEAYSIRSKLKNVAYIPQIEKEMIALKAKILKRHKRKKHSISSHTKLHKKEEKELVRKIDPDVNLLLNNKFNLTLNEIKAELSKRVKDKEEMIKKQLKEDLENRKMKFESKYGKLEKNLSDKYHEKIKSSLNKEIKKRFNSVLNRKIKELKEKLEKESSKKIELSKEQIEILRNKLNKEFMFKKSKVEKEYGNKLSEYKEEMKKCYDKNTLLHKADLTSKMSKHLAQEKQRLNREKKIAIRQMKKEEEVNEREMEMEKEEFTKEIKEKDRESAMRKAEEMSRKKVKKQTEIIKDKLKREFEQRLKMEIKRKEAEFDKKKADLILEIQNKARTIFR